ATYTPDVSDTVHLGSSGNTSISAQAKSIPLKGRPDLVIRRAAKNAKWVGENIYSGSGAHERVHSFVKNGQSVVAYFKVENDSPNKDTISVGGRSSQAGFTAKYYRGTHNITKLVAGHGYN